MRTEDITDKFLSTVDVCDILPQREPFVMVGRIVHFGMGTTTSETLVREDNIFVEDGFFSPCGIMENIAQTCASRIGIYNKYVLGHDVQIGYIGAIRDCSFTGEVLAGSLLTTRIDVLEEVFGMTLASATVECGGRKIASANLKLAVKDAGD